MKIKIENENPHSLKMKIVENLKMKVYNVPCGKFENENENPHVFFSKMKIKTKLSTICG